MLPSNGEQTNVGCACKGQWKMLYRQRGAFMAAAGAIGSQSSADCCTQRTRSQSWITVSGVVCQSEVLTWCLEFVEIYEETFVAIRENPILKFCSSFKWVYLYRNRYWTWRKAAVQSMELWNLSFEFKIYCSFDDVCASRESTGYFARTDKASLSLH